MASNLDVEQRAVIRNLMRQAKNAQQVAEELQRVYGANALPYHTVCYWMREFRRGRESIQNQPQPGRPPTVTDELHVAAVQNLVMEDRRIKVREIAASLGISIDRVDYILRKKLRLSKLCSRWVPRLLTKDQKQRRAQLSLSLFHRFEENPANFCDRFVTGDETWVHYYDPETKQQSMLWTARGGRPEVKAKVVPSAGKVMLTLFWDSKGPLLVDFLPPKTTITGLYYAELLSKLRNAIKEKRRGKLSHGVMLLHDNAPVHKAYVAHQVLSKCGFEELDHPAYSPDLAPSDFHVFKKLKSDLKGKRFFDDDEVKAAVCAWLDSMPLEFWNAGVMKCRDRWLKCHNIDGDYVEK
jgi:histone-lysine N-methyltransferase SETMAR